MVKHKRLLGLMSLVPYSVSAEVSEYRIGNLAEDAIDVLGFNLTDASYALPELLGLVLVLVLILAGILLWRKHSKG